MKKNYSKIFKLYFLSLLLLLSAKDYCNDANIVKNNIKTFEEDNDDMIKLYDSYLDVLANYYSDLDLDNIFSEYSFMLKNGYISYGYSFEPGEPELDANKYGGIDVINGKGVCRNINCCFTDLLKKMGYDAGNMYGILEDGKKIYIKPNHVITWVKLNNKIYLYDATNNVKFNKEMDLYYNLDKELIFIPAHLTTQLLDDDLHLDTILYSSSNNDSVIELNSNDLLDYKNFEKENLLDIEKEVYIKIKSLQTN